MKEMRTIALGLCCLAVAVIAAESQIRIPDKPPSQVGVHFRLQEKAVSLHEPQPITVTVGSANPTILRLLTDNAQRPNPS